MLARTRAGAGWTARPSWYCRDPTLPAGPAGKRFDRRDHVFNDCYWNPY